MRKQKPFQNSSIASNKKAFFNYEILEKYEAGMVLYGSEVKSVRLRKVSLADAYCYFKNNELWAQGIHISPYKPAAEQNHLPTRSRKLLLTRRELRKLRQAKEQKRCTIVVLRLFFNPRNRIKIEIALARGKKRHDKRLTIKKRDLDRSVARELR